MNNKRNKIELELNKKRKELFTQAIKEAEKIRKSKKKQDILKHKRIIKEFITILLVYKKELG